MATSCKFAVGTHAPETGRYTHTACLNTEIFYRGDVIASCVKKDCPNRKKDWLLQEKHAEAHGGPGSGEVPSRMSL
jgi:hypothetical protein